MAVHDVLPRGRIALAVPCASSLFLFCLFSCGDGDGITEPTPPPVGSVEVTPSTGSLQVGGSLPLTAVPKDASGNALSGRTVTWSSSDETVVTVSSGGLVTGVGAGVASVTATCEGKQDSATITVPAFTLTVQKAGAGSGTVTSSPTGIDCGGTCSASFGSGTVLTLSASAGTGSEFAGWSGACTGTQESCQVTVDAARSVTATFRSASSVTYALTVWKSGTGNGTVSSEPGGIDCGSACLASYGSGTGVTLTASPSQGSIFIRWSGACSGTESTCQVSMEAEHLVMAEFSGGPRVISSVPEHRAESVDPWIEAVEFRFSQPMMNCGFRSFGWYPYDYEWSEDRKTLRLVRRSAGTPLYGHRARFDALRNSCISLVGDPLEADFTLSFTTAYRVPPIRVGPNAGKGFHWPYYLVLPTEMVAPNTLLIEPNNTGTTSDDFQEHEAAATNLMSWRIPFAEELGSPLLIPVFPRPKYPPAPEPGGIYTHALDRYSLTNDHAGLERIDLQMVAMIDDALGRLEELGHEMDRGVFMMGFSASGAFTSRFSLIHPDRIKAAAAGSPGGWPLAPISSWEGTPLKYAMGVMDLESLVGRPFDLETFRTVPLYIYVGDEDTNDAFDVRGLPAEEREQIHDLLNWPDDPILANRWPLAEAMYESVGANAQFVVYPGVAHTITEEMFADVQSFFRAHR